MYGILCTLSPKRLTQLAEDPEVLEDVLDAREDEEIPGLLDVGKVWDALDLILSDRGKDAVLGDVVLARTGKKLYVESSFENARVLAPDRVAEVAKKLGALPPTVVKDRYPQLAGKNVHGRYGKDPEEVPGLEIILARVVQLYLAAADQKHSMLCVVI